MDDQAKTLKALETLREEIKKSIDFHVTSLANRQLIQRDVEELITKMKSGEAGPEDFAKTDMAFRHFAETELEAMKKMTIKTSEGESKKPDAPAHEAPKEGAQQIEFFDDGSFIVIK